MLLQSESTQVGNALIINGIAIFADEVENRWAMEK